MFFKYKMLCRKKQLAKPDGKVKNDSSGISSNSCISSSEISGSSRSTNLNTTYEIDDVINDNLNIGDSTFERNINVACATFNDSPGRAFTIGLFEPVEITVDHNHEPTPEKLPCLQSVDEIKYRAQFTNENPRTIINGCQTKIDEESSKYMVRSTNLAQMVHRKRNERPEFQDNASNV